MPASRFTVDVSTAPAGGRRCRLQGQVTLAEGEALWSGLSAQWQGGDPIELDLAGVDHLDGGAAALLHALVQRERQGGRRVDVVGARGETARLWALYDCRESLDCSRLAPQQPGMLNEVGDFAVTVGHETKAILAFAGDLVFGAVQAFRRPKSLHLTDLPGLLERAGTDAVPIVLLINFLVGAVMAIQGAIQLHRFGGDTFLASLVGLSIAREFGPLMTAILVTGRSGAGYAAELGTMTVNEEIDALRTLGQDPQRFLVFPRVLALVLAMPVLVLLADFAGIAGGLLVAVTWLEQPAVVYLQSLQQAVDLVDLGTGLLKCFGFALAIGLIACQRGLATRGGAAGVGRATTSAVVVVLFTLVVVDAVFTNVFSLLGW